MSKKAELKQQVRDLTSENKELHSKNLQLLNMIQDLKQNARVQVENLTELNQQVATEIYMLKSFNQQIATEIYMLKMLTT